MKKYLFALIFSLILCGISISQAQVPTDGLVAFYPFSGNANDASGNDNNGTVNGATLAPDRFGNANSAYSFDGNDWVEVLHNESIDFSISESYSTSVWVQFSNEPQSGTILSKWTNSFNPHPYSVRVETTGFDSILIASGRYIGGLPQDETHGQSSNAVIGFESESFHHIVSVYEPNFTHIYVDGVMEKSTPNLMIDGDISNTYNLYIGRRSGRNDRFFKGTIDDLRIYSKVITPQEVTSLYNEGKCFEIVYDTVLVTVTDTLLINTIVTGHHPISYKNTIKVYPNPSKEVLWINCGDYSEVVDYRLKITNSLSQEIWSTYITQGLYNVDIHSFGGAGLYFLEVYDADMNKIDVKKIVIQ